MTQANKLDKWGELAGKIEPCGKLLRAWELVGGVSATVTALELECADGTRKKMVVRQHGAADRERNPQIASDEYKLLQLLQEAHIPAPQPLHLEASATIFASPCLVTTFVEGQTGFQPANLSAYLSQLAEVLARIHRIDPEQKASTFLPRQTDWVADTLRKTPEKLDDSLDEGLIRELLGTVWPLARKNRDVLLHGDFWPGNTMWLDGRLTAVLDWEDAAVGDPLADVGNARLELLWAFGSEAMDTFTAFYRERMPDLDYTDLAYWDLYAALRPASSLGNWGLDQATEQRMRERHKQFVQQATERRHI
ncbi:MULTISPECIES: phosphotransferase family protein [Brevibacillus]|uniref:phosphotransferase family protein n=1 Tax=Brevibacillus TaxID=55080 RepID=UPI000EBFF907|nr:phosphotransferase family protein [Brevibacillus sp.]HBZ82264.1 phosphotransferase family protein [Brevibacillus sp.]